MRLCRLSYVIYASHFQQSPSIVASGSTDGTVCTWDLESGRQVHTMKAHRSTVLDVTVTKSHIGSIGMDCKFCIWDQKKGILLHAILFVS